MLQHHTLTACLECDRRQYCAKSGLACMLTVRVSLRRGQAPPGKRKLLPAPKPLGGNVGALSQEELFGQGFKLPKLGR